MFDSAPFWCWQIFDARKRKGDEPITRKLFWMIFVAPVLGAATLSAGAEESTKSAPAQSGIQLSEWGRETRLPELTASAWSETRDESELPDFGEFLSEEARTLGAGALDSEQLRDMMANRAIGREDDSVMSWMSSRWESAPGRFANFLTDYAEARMNALPGVENAEFDWSPTGDDAFGAFSASGVGALRLSESQALGFQPKIERAQDDGRLTGTFGLFHRRGFGDSAVAGVNIFSQHTDDPEKGSFSRWWVGADFASSWVDADFKRYIGGDGRNIWRNGRRFHAYAPDGLSAELRVHSPDMLWLEGYAKFTEWRGRGGNSDSREKSVGLTFQPYAGPLAGLRADAEFAKDKANLEFAYAWTIGEGGILPRLADPFAVYSDIAKPVDDPAEFDIHDFELYETAHLYEVGVMLNANHTIGLTNAELYRRISLAWDLVEPPYMRVSESLRSRCPVPQFISLYRRGGLQLDSLCASLNGDGSNPLGWWIGGGTAGALIFYHAAERVNVDAVKLLIIGGETHNAKSSVANARGIFSNLHIPGTPGAGSDWFALNHSPGTPRQNLLEGVAMRISLARVHNDTDQINNARTIAKILKANGGVCRPEMITDGIREGCEISLDGLDMGEQTETEFQRVRVPEGGIMPVSVPPYVAPGYTGEVFRVTADTDYADVNHFLVQSEENFFSISVAGEFTDYEGRGKRETRYNHSDDTKIAVVRLTSSAATSGEHALSIRSEFFYHRITHNMATLGLTVSILAQPERQTLIVADDYTGTVAFSLPDVPELTFVESGSAAKVNVVNGQININSALTIGESAVLTLRATSPFLRGELELEYEAHNPALNDKRGLAANVSVDCFNANPAGSDDANEDLFDAAVGNNEEDACAAIMDGGDVNHIKNNISMLRYSLRRQNLTMQRILLANGLSVEQDSKYGKPLHQAVYYGDDRLVRHLVLNQSADVNAVSALDGGNTPIHALAERTNRLRGNPVEVAKILVDNGADVNALNSGGRNYLHIVVGLGTRRADFRSWDTVLETGDVNPNLSDPVRETLPLVQLIKLGLTVRAKKLVTETETLLSINAAQPSNGYAAIHEVRSEGMLDYLILNDANVHLVTDVEEEQQVNLMDILISKDDEDYADMIEYIYLYEYGECHFYADILESEDERIFNLCNYGEHF